MTESMIERVARAICRAGITGPKDHLNEQENSNWRKFESEARAAIEAMREPTERMCEAADWTQQSEVKQYQWAIDAALIWPAGSADRAGVPLARD